MPRAAMPGNAVLDRVQLETPADAWRIRPRAARTVERLATLSARQWVLASAPELPEVPMVREFALSWTNLRDDGVLRRLVASPKDYRLVLWRFEDLTYRGTGQRREWRLPNGWTLAIDGTPSQPSPGLEPSKFELQARLAPDGPVLPVHVREPAIYDAGEPSPDEVWRSLGESRFKLGEALGEDAILYVSVVPVYRVLIATDEAEIQLTRPLVEPHELRLLEAPGVLS